MPGGYGFEQYPQTKSPQAAQIGQQLQMQGQMQMQAQAVPPGAMAEPGMSLGDPMADGAEMGFSPLPSQSSGNPVTRPELVPGQPDTSTSAAIGQLLSRTAGGAGKNRPLMPPSMGQDDLLLRAGFSPEELALYKEMGGIK